MKFLLVLRGENFEVKFDGRFENMGFFATRIVRAGSLEEAEVKAVNAIRNDSKLLDLLNKHSVYEPRIFLDNWKKAPWWKRIGGSGYGFYPMD